MSIQRILSPYIRLMRLHQPVGIWLLLWPCWWSASLAAQGGPQLWILLLLAIGAVLMRSAGCIVNDLIDRDFDAKVERTSTRPLASGELQPHHAYAVLALLLGLALAIALELGLPVLQWSVASLPLVAAYPWMKRITWWPQLFLGLTFNWGALVGWVAVKGHIDAPALMMYLGGVFWTLGYDTIYAHQDKNDDAVIGVKSAALKLGSASKPVIRVFYVAAIVCFFLTKKVFLIKLPFFLLLLAALAQAMRQVWQVDLNDPASCKKAFASNAYQFGWLVFAAIVYG